MMGTVGGATLASQAIVLGASMFKQDPEEQTVGKQVTSPGGQLRSRILNIIPLHGPVAAIGQLIAGDLLHIQAEAGRHTV